MIKLFIGCYNKSVILTYIGAICSILGMFYVEHMTFAIICLMLAGICDLFDGKIARMCKRTEQEKEFGIQIDSLVDVVSSVVFPVVILGEGCSMFLDSYSIWGVLTVLGASIYLLAGVIRLAWFNITTDGHTSYYSGLPVTSICIILPLVYLIFSKLWFFEYALLATFYIVGFLFVFNMPVKKLTGIWYVIFSVLAIIFSIVFFMFF